MALRLLIDSADVQQWSDLWPLGLFHGITTNPTLLRRAGVPCTLDSLVRLTDQALDLGFQELHLQAWGGTADAFLACAEALHARAPEAIVIKLPLTEAGLHAAALLGARGVRLTLTACYGSAQVLAAAALGAAYVAPYLGRISDSGVDGRAEVIRMQRCLDGAESPTRLLVASLRSLDDILALVPMGVDTFTLSPSLARQLWSHPSTEQAAAQFEVDALAVNAEAWAP